MTGIKFHGVIVALCGSTHPLIWLQRQSGKLCKSCAGGRARECSKVKEMQDGRQKSRAAVVPLAEGPCGDLICCHNRSLGLTPAGRPSEAVGGHMSLGCWKQDVTGRVGPVLLTWWMLTPNHLVNLSQFGDGLQGGFLTQTQQKHSRN